MKAIDKDYAYLDPRRPRLSSSGRRLFAALLLSGAIPALCVAAVVWVFF